MVMDKVLSIISDYVSTCTSCRMGYEGKCGFIMPNPPVSVENNPYDYEEYRKLTHEQRAFRNERDCTSPCDEQINFAAIIDKVEEALEQTTIDFDTKKVLRYLTKMNNMTKSIDRQPMYLLFAFDDIVKTCLERCIAHIDYCFLEYKMDIEEAILSVFPEYNRHYALCISHPETFVKTYLSQAIKISLDKMISQSTDLRIIRQEIEDGVYKIIEEGVGVGSVADGTDSSMQQVPDTSVDSIDDDDLSFNFVKASGVEEVDHFFKLIIEERNDYPDDKFYADLKKFRKKCENMANGDESLERKEAWVVSVINVLGEAFFHFAWDEYTEIAERIIDFWGVIEAAFMRAPQQICIKQLALELSIDDIITTIPPETKKRLEECPDESRTNPISITELALYKELGPAIGYSERRICKHCSNKECIFRWGTKKMYEEEFEVEADGTIPDRSAPSISDIPVVHTDIVSIPKELEGDGIKYISRLTEYCDSNHRWIDVQQKTLMCQAAHIIGGLIKIPPRRKWKPFEELWGVSGLATYYYKRNCRTLDKEIRDIFPEYKGC